MPLFMRVIALFCGKLMLYVFKKLNIKKGSTEMGGEGIEFWGGWEWWGLRRTIVECKFYDKV